MKLFRAKKNIVILGFTAILLLQAHADGINSLMIFKACNSLSNTNQQELFLPVSNDYSSEENQAELCVVKNQYSEPNDIVSIFENQKDLVEKDQDSKLFDHIYESIGLPDSVENGSLINKEIEIIFSQEGTKIIDLMTEDASKKNNIKLYFVLDGEIVTSLITIEHVQEGKLNIITTDQDFNKVWEPLLTQPEK